jgi:small subunit ribosomal protein S17
MRTKKGIITSAKMMGTVTVTVHRSVFHPLYQKRFTRSKKFLADTGNLKDLAEGDTVVVTECRPLSKRKCFRVTEVIKRAPRVSEIKEEEVIEKTMHREKKRPASTSSESSPSSASSASSK